MTPGFFCLYWSISTISILLAFQSSRRRWTNKMYTYKRLPRHALATRINPEDEGCNNDDHATLRTSKSTGTHICKSPGMNLMFEFWGILLYMRIGRKKNERRESDIWVLFKGILLTQTVIFISAENLLEATSKVACICLPIFLSHDRPPRCRFQGHVWMRGGEYEDGKGDVRIFYKSTPPKKVIFPLQGIYYNWQ